VQKGSTLKVMEEFNIQGKQTSFYKYCPGTFGYNLVKHLYQRRSHWTDFREILYGRLLPKSVEKLQI